MRKRGEKEGNGGDSHGEVGAEAARRAAEGFSGCGVHRVRFQDDVAVSAGFDA